MSRYIIKRLLIELISMQKLILGALLDATLTPATIKDASSILIFKKIMSIEKIRQVLKDHARLAVDIATLADDADLYEAGMTSHASVNVMLALEDAFDLEFPDRMLKRSVFESMAAMNAAIQELTA